MKRTFCIVVMLCVAVFGICAQNAVIREMTGEVEIKPAGASAFVPAQAGDEVAQDTVVSTGFKSTAIITVGSSEITVRPLPRPPVGYESGGGTTSATPVTGDIIFTFNFIP